MALFKRKKDNEGSKEYDETLVAEEEPSEFKFQFSKPETGALRPMSDESSLGEEDLLEIPREPEATSAAPSGGFDAAPLGGPAATATEPEESPIPPEAAPFTAMREGRLVLREYGFPREQKTRLEGLLAQNVKTDLKEVQWIPKHREALASIQKAVDHLEIHATRRDTKARKWLRASFDQLQEKPEPGRLELIPANIISKRILYESEGGFVVEVLYRDVGELFKQYFTVSNKGGRSKALASVKSGNYAPVTAVTADQIRALRRPAVRKGTVRVQPGKISTYHIENTVDLKAVEGIGDVYQARLKEIGFYTIDQLRLGNPKILAGNLGVLEGAVRNWQQKAELMLIHGVGPQNAELLVRVGVTSIADLKKASAKELMKRIRAIKRMRGARIGPKTLNRIVRNARQMKPHLQSFPRLGPPS